MEGEPAHARSSSEPQLPQHQRQREQQAQREQHTASRATGQASGESGHAATALYGRLPLSGRLGMLGEAVNNWGQGTLDLDQVGSGQWAVDPRRLQRCK